MENRRQRYRLNVVGDFYVEDGCCTMCGVPFAEAPDLFGGFEPDGTVLVETEQCWVKKQPSADAELVAMIEAIRRQELGCIRYAGTDPRVVQRLRDAGEGPAIDHPQGGASLRDRLRTWLTSR